MIFEEGIMSLDNNNNHNEHLNGDNILNEDIARLLRQFFSTPTSTHPSTPTNLTNTNPNTPLPLPPSSPSFQYLHRDISEDACSILDPSASLVQLMTSQYPLSSSSSPSSPLSHTSVPVPDSVSIPAPGSAILTYPHLRNPSFPSYPVSPFYFFFPPQVPPYSSVPTPNDFTPQETPFSGPLPPQNDLEYTWNTGVATEQSPISFDNSSIVSSSVISASLSSSSSSTSSSTYSSFLSSATTSRWIQKEKEPEKERKTKRKELKLKMELEKGENKEKRKKKGKGKEEEEMEEDSEAEEMEEEEEETRSQEEKLCRHLHCNWVEQQGKRRNFVTSAGRRKHERVAKHHKCTTFARSSTTIAEGTRGGEGGTVPYCVICNVREEFRGVYVEKPWKCRHELCERSFKSKNRRSQHELHEDHGDCKRRNRITCERCKTAQIKRIEREEEQRMLSLYPPTIDRRRRRKDSHKSND